MFNRYVLQYLIPSLVILFILGGTIWWTLPTVQNFFYLRNEQINSQRETVSFLESKKNILLSFNSADLDRNIQQTRYAIPDDAAPSHVLALVEYLAEQSGVTVVSPAFISGNSATDQEVIITVNAIGSLVAYQQFLGSLTSAAPVLSVERFISTQTEEGVEANTAQSFRATIEIVSPFVFLPTVIGSINDRVAPLSLQEREAIQKIAEFERYEGILPPHDQIHFPGGKRNLFIE